MSWLITTVSVRPASRSTSDSPTQRIGESWLRQCRAYLFVNVLVLFAEQRAPFRMADDDIAAAEVSQHRSRTSRR